ncbi:MAG: MnmC family methyltransferase, partial [Bacteroidota bacterium]
VILTPHVGTFTEEIFIKMYNGLRDKGILVTYSCKGSVRRLLQSIGFLVSRIPGPPGGKKEMIRAEKTG